MALIGCRSAPIKSLVGVWANQDPHGKSVLQLHDNGNFDLIAANDFAAGFVGGRYNATDDHLTLHMSSGGGLGDADWSYRWTGPDEIVMTSKFEPGKEERYERVSKTPIDLTKPSSTDPAVTGARTPERVESDMQSSCAVNLKSLSQASLEYANDWDERFMQSGNWTTALVPYAKSPAFFSCPAVSATGQSGGYAMNATLSAALVSQIPEPSNSILLFEAAAGVTEGNPDSVEIRAARHGGVVNRAYADGHVTSEKP